MSFYDTISLIKWQFKGIVGTCALVDSGILTNTDAKQAVLK